MFSIGFPHVRHFPLPKITGVAKFVGNGIFNQSKKLWITFPFWYLTGSGQWRINPWASSTRYIFLARVLLMSLHQIIEQSAALVFEKVSYKIMEAL